MLHPIFSGTTMPNTCHANIVDRGKSEKVGKVCFFFLCGDSDVGTVLFAGFPILPRETAIPHHGNNAMVERKEGQKKPEDRREGPPCGTKST